VIKILRSKNGFYQAKVDVNGDAFAKLLTPRTVILTSKN